MTARIRQLSSTGEQLYIQWMRAELSSLGLDHMTAVSVELPGSEIVRGVVKTSGSTPWLAPGADSNARITEVLRGAGFEHKDECRVRVTLA